jgi:CheY-like chemotaxis protein
MPQVLLVDDEPGQLRVRELVLRSAGFGVQLASEGQSALDRLLSADSQIGLLITDHNLPGLRGPELVRQLRQTYPALPVVILTGMPGIEPEYDGLEVIIRSKPLPAPELIDLVRRLLPGDRQSALA